MVTVRHHGINTVRKRLAGGGVRVYYYHRATGIRLPEDPASPEFAEALRDLAAAESAAGPIPGSFAALIEAFLDSPEFRSKSGQTRRDYRRYLDIIRASWGHHPVRRVSREAVLELRDAFADRPRTANYAVAVLRLLLAYAVDRPSVYGLHHNPAARPRQLKTDGGHRPWEESEIAAFRRCWPLGSLERTAFELCLNTGQRGGDVAGMARSHIVGGRIQVAQEKTKTRVSIPVSADLAEALAAWDSSQEERIAGLESRGRPVPIAAWHRVLTTPSGRAVSVDYFRHLMIDAMQAVPDLVHGLERGGVTTHGLRYTAATILRELDVDWETIADITGHRTREMVRHYTRQRRRTELAIARLDDARRPPGPAEPER